MPNIIHISVLAKQICVFKEKTIKEPEKITGSLIFANLKKTKKG